jgi:hypothetical protein
MSTAVTDAAERRWPGTRGEDRPGRRRSHADQQDSATSHVRVGGATASPRAARLRPRRGSPQPTRAGADQSQLGLSRAFASAMPPRHAEGPGRGLRATLPFAESVRDHLRLGIGMAVVLRCSRRRPPGLGAGWGGRLGGPRRFEHRREEVLDKSRSRITRHSPQRHIVSPIIWLAAGSCLAVGAAVTDSGRTPEPQRAFGRAAQLPPR